MVLKNVSPFKHGHFWHLLLMEEIRLTTWDVLNPVTNGINYQPQLVIAGFLPSTVC